MKFETINNKNKILLIPVIVFVVVLTLIINTSLAKYKITQSIPLVSGTISYSPHDIKIETKLLVGDDEYIALDEIPDSNLVDIASTTCTNDATIIYNGEYSGYQIFDLTQKGTKCEVIYASFISEKFDYSGKVEEYIVEHDGNYLLETWGAQGGYGSNETYRGGYGGYSKGIVNLESSNTLYVAVGGAGNDSTTASASLNSGGFNGGGNTYGTTSKYLGSGGGATHIAKVTGELSELENNKEDILIVSGGGGAGGYESTTYSSTGGDAGGYIGNSGTTTNTTYAVGTGGTQSSGGTGNVSGTFGQGGNATEDSIGGGGGFYGGGAGKYSSGSGGGSGYIGNSLLTDKYMYCYNCTESEEENIKTLSTTNVSETAISNYAKKGNGYAKITLLEPNPYKPIINIELEKSENNINVNVNYDSNNLYSASKYYYSINDSEYVESENNTYTFNNLDYDNYVLRIYVKDSKNLISEIYSKSITITPGLTVEDIIASKTVATRTDFSTILTTDTTGTIYSAEDDDGTSYYYAGAPTDNWVKFGGFYWRIIRFNGDGSIRLIYQGKSANSTGADAQIGTSAFNSGDSNNSNVKIEYSGYMYTLNEVHGLGTSSTIKGVLDNWYISSGLSNYASYIDTNAGFCGDRTAYSDVNGTLGGGTGQNRTYYGDHIRLQYGGVPTLKCANISDFYTTNDSNKGNKALTYPIGLLNMNEAWLAGGAYNTVNNNYYLYSGKDYWTMSPSYLYFYNSYTNGAAVYFVLSTGSIGWYLASGVGVRPVINLKTGTLFNKDSLGTSDNPYVVEG